jgi:hypothetical protein
MFIIAVLFPKKYKIATGCSLKIMFLELERMLKNVKKSIEEMVHRENN